MGLTLFCLSNEALAALLYSAPALYDFGQTTVVRLYEDLVLKGGGNVLPCEAEALGVVASKTGIRAPRVHRSFQVTDDTKYFGTMGYIVMDYIDGRPLDTCWKGLGDEQKLEVSRQVAQIITEMHSIKLPEPGPIQGGPCRGRFFTHYGAGPFNSSSEFEGWFNHKLDISRTFNKASPDIRNFRFAEFVLTHQDISPRNLILDRHGHAWIVDWADAGAYPPAFETAALSYQQSFFDFNAIVLSYLPRYPLEKGQLESIGSDLTTAALA
ncbi:kinase-like domain-containing protein [Aspergillus karnatakaensis]|uniref:aminoglycoside phosphotransferase family protein n=1 Tax=Aspergillus karnatakaensis TaxID=1810916 RepID=UPI003CCC93C7